MNANARMDAEQRKSLKHVDALESDLAEMLRRRFGLTLQVVAIDQNLRREILEWIDFAAQCGVHSPDALAGLRAAVCDMTADEVHVLARGLIEHHPRRPRVVSAGASADTPAIALSLTQGV